MSIETLNAQQLMASAQEKTGLTDFGGNDFQEGLQVLLDTYASNGFNQAAHKKLVRRLRDLLMARLRIEAAFKRHPEIRDIEIEQPMFLTGLPRTGTSALLNLLANDPAARPLKLWEGLNPDPIEGLAPGEEDPRYLALKQFYDSVQGDSEFSKIHHTDADTPEECIHLLNHTFQDVQFGIETMMEPYASWFQQQDLRPSYRYYADLLRMLQWQRPGERWLLKTPGHLWALDILVDMFPDCCIVITHRNPVEAVTSYASMMAALMEGRDNLDRKALGPIVMEYLAVKLQASLKAREHIDPQRIIDIQFNDFVAEPLRTAYQIYDYFQLPLSNQTTKAMEQYAASHPMGKHGSHDYQLQEYGLSEKQILDRFAFSSPLY